MEHLISMTTVLIVGFIILIGGMLHMKGYWHISFLKMKDEFYWGGAYLLAFSTELAFRIAF